MLKVVPGVVLKALEPLCNGDCENSLRGRTLAVDVTGDTIFLVSWASGVFE